ncbi:MAG: 50S ribosomal protein L6 [Bacteroidetes bacterium]|jgi:large subunit ribosomal protein L6|nr:50S ribosomal protein L6 [Bacteroidota bacterium]MBP7389440.1 50S ribosomal protein L6 [Chitinophagales bacterium]
MSRIGKSPISLPKGVTIEVSGSNVVKVKGPKGELFQAVDPDIAVKIDNGVITVERPTEQKRHKALHGTYRALINNMVKGVSDGYTAQLELVGVGYRADVAKQALTLSVGYSHPVVVLLPEEIKASAKQDKGQNPIVTLETFDKELLGLVCAKIRSIRKSEPYKGKGIKFVGETLRRKAGKSAAKK